MKKNRGENVEVKEGMWRKEPKLKKRTYKISRVLGIERGHTSLMCILGHSFPLSTLEMNL